MTRGVVGNRNLNKVLQQLINPPSEEKTELVRGDSILRTGYQTKRGTPWSAEGWRCAIA
ncbi:MAG: hypothetical protein QNJ55_35150 [Xenococcus sp. MO_188.B8]|nr:hypothetical protein [Xenococcus sp. MO_188.B8]